MHRSHLDGEIVLTLEAAFELLTSCSNSKVDTVVVKTKRKSEIKTGLQKTMLGCCFAQETDVTLRSSAAQIPWVALASACTDESYLRAPPRRSHEVISQTTWVFIGVMHWTLWWQKDMLQNLLPMRTNEIQHNQIIEQNLVSPFTGLHSLFDCMAWPCIAGGKFPVRMAAFTK